ncbi:MULTISPECIES: hypothetical protein [unclassified Nocardioides]|uniref:hypothetical protein n=1 Tax=Nocardioides sp. URHA0032 TaxID=1380388 RepID=UPI000490878F|nr:hypothetical protein [Nocardioides sp. URHA0032]
MRLAIAVPLLAVATLLVGCGDDTGDATAGDPTGGAPTSSATSPSPSEKPVGVQRSCAELYHPPQQLMPRAIDFVHGSPSAQDSGRADDLVAGLADAEGHALEPLAVDIATTREGVESKLSGGAPSMAEFDKAVNRLARHCELFGD